MLVWLDVLAVLTSNNPPTRTRVTTATTPIFFSLTHSFFQLTVYDPAHPDVNYWFHSVADSLAISYDGGVIYEPTSNKTVVKVKIEHEKGYSTGKFNG